MSVRLLQQAVRTAFRPDAHHLVPDHLQTVRDAMWSVACTGLASRFAVTPLLAEDVRSEARVVAVLVFPTQTATSADSFNLVV